MNRISGPQISVIITCYNDGIYIEEAIESVEKSTFKNFEIIIVDDCSTDDETKSILKELERKGHFILWLPKNGDLGNARNQGIKIAKGNYILPLDADDRIINTYLEKASAVLDKDKSTGVVYCNVKRFGELSDTWMLPPYSFSRLLTGNYIVSASLFRKECWNIVGGYDTSLVIYEDWEFWVAIGSKGFEMHHLNEVLFEYRAKKISKITKSHNAETRAKVVKYIVNKYKEHFKNNVVEIIPNLYATLTNLEQANKLREDVSSNYSYEEVLEKLVTASNDLIRMKAYYEGSIFWKLKLQFNKLKIKK